MKTTKHLQVSLRRRLNRARLIASLLVAWLGWLLSLCAPTLPAFAQERQPSAPLVELPRIELRAGMHRIVAEVASTHEARSKGLMFREQLPLNQGMLFIFEQPSHYCFWMKNTPLPLSIAFLRNDGTIAKLADMQALSEKSHCSNEAVRFALEMEQGWFARKGLREGSRIGHQGLFGAP